MQVNLLNHQWEFLHSKTKFTLLLGGIGSGKTFAGAQYVINKITSDPRARGFIGANTYGQLTKSTLSCLFSLLTEYGISFSYNQNKGIITIGKTEIIAATMDNYDIHRGIEIGWAWLDESRDMKKEAVEVVMGRLRDKRCKSHEIRFTSSPKGFNWMYEWFSKNSREFRFIQARSRDNTYLPDGYLDTLYEQYSPQLAEQELEGKFVNINQGSVYNEFDRDKHVTECRYLLTDKDQIYFFTDYNISNYCGVYCIFKGGIVYFIGEEHLRFEGSRVMAQTVRSRYPYRPIIVVGDSTGNNKRDVAIDQTNYQHFQQAGLLTERFTNPPVQSRIISANSNFYHNRVVVDPSCKTFIKDLELLSWKEDGKDIDKSNIDLSHASDAGTYALWYFIPIKPRIRSLKVSKYV